MPDPATPPPHCSRPFLRQPRDGDTASARTTCGTAYQALGAAAAEAAGTAASVPESAAPLELPAPAACVEPAGVASSPATMAVEALAAAASRAINAHVNDNGACAACHDRFPCPTACLAEANLAALCQQPASLPPLKVPQLLPRTASPARLRPRIRPCRDLETLNRVLAGLKGLDN